MDSTAPRIFTFTLRANTNHSSTHLLACHGACLCGQQHQHQQLCNLASPVAYAPDQTPTSFATQMISCVLMATELTPTKPQPHPGVCWPLITHVQVVPTMDKRPLLQISAP